jgi:hypothetical protein
MKDPVVMERFCTFTASMPKFWLRNSPTVIQVIIIEENW